MIIHTYKQQPGVPAPGQRHRLKHCWDWKLSCDAIMFGSFPIRWLFVNMRSLNYSHLMRLDETHNWQSSHHMICNFPNCNRFRLFEFTRRRIAKHRALERASYLIWGFAYTFTNYLLLCQNTLQLIVKPYLEVIVVFEVIAGETVVKSPYNKCLMPAVRWTILQHTKHDAGYVQVSLGNCSGPRQRQTPHAPNLRVIRLCGFPWFHVFC